MIWVNPKHFFFLSNFRAQRSSFIQTTHELKDTTSSGTGWWYRRQEGAKNFTSCTSVGAFCRQTYDNPKRFLRWILLFLRHGSRHRWRPLRFQWHLCVLFWDGCFLNGVMKILQVTPPGMVYKTQAQDLEMNGPYLVVCSKPFSNSITRSLHLLTVDFRIQEERTRRESFQDW